MANDLPKVGAEALLIHDKYDRDIAAVIKRADQADKALSDISGTVDVKVAVDDSQIDSAYTSLLDLEKDASIKVNVDDTDLGTAVKIVDDLGSATPNVKIATKDEALDTSARKIKDIDSAAPDVKVSASDKALDDVLSKLQQVRDLAIINIVMNFDAAQLEDAPILGTLLDVEAAVRKIQGQTGLELPGIGEDVKTLFTSNWGDSADQIADLYVKLLQAGVAQEDLVATSTDVFQAMTVAGGDDPLEMFNRMDTLVKNDLVPNLGEAADAIAFFHQQGLNRSGDLSDSLDEYSQTIADTGLSLGAWFKLQQAGLEAGIRDTDKIADAYKEMFNLTREEVSINMASGDETDRTNALEQLGLMDEASAYTAGKLTADKFAEGLIDTLNAVEDPAEQRRLGLAIFGPSMVEDAGLPGLLAADLSDSSEMSEAWQGIADEGSAIITDTLSSAWSEAMRTLNVEVSDFLNEQFDLTGRIDTAKTQLQTFISELKSGSSVGEAIEFALEIPGFNDAVGRFEASVGGFAINILELIAGVQDFTGKDSSQTRTEIARLGEQQLAFNLTVANADEIGGEIATAINRGVDAEGIVSATNEAINTLLGQGEIKEAQALLDSLTNTAGAVLEVGGIVNQTITMPVAPELNEAEYQAWVDETVARITSETGAPVTVTFTEIDADEINKLQEQVDAAVAAVQPPPPNWSAFFSGTNPLVPKVVNEGAFNPKGGMGDAGRTGGWWSSFTPTSEAITAIEDAQTTIDTSAQAVSTSFNTLDIALTDSAAAIVDQIGTIDTAAAEMDANVATSLTGNTVTASFIAVQEQASISFPIIIDWVDQTAQVVADLDAKIMGLQSSGIGAMGVLASLSGAVDDFPLTRLETIVGLAMGFGGAETIVNDNSNNPTNVTVNNNNTNGAQASTSTYDIARAVGGG